MSSHENAPDQARVIQLRPGQRPAPPAAPPKEPLWRDLVGDVLRRERLAQQRTLKDVADEARISMPYLSEVERGRKEASSEVLAAAARALGLSLAELLGRVQGEILKVTALTSAAPSRAATSVSAHTATSVTSLTSAAPARTGTSVSTLGRGEVRLAA
ncbi:helix-turn-helix domain-containing protein [Streptomyces indicus]|uniref:Transcriptional regulator, contains XRE-family HTH domain n=1 Tax=Streptomyces indicus TaxID=417292 RepID=A0A1G8UGG2_9ACTN|nr:helix-turn-helix domain-containing protein [Streptomyces indicus]SDJ52818.1 Transcriptional regulator, contains XRE-family HTH domain [Streptomyces indicus]